MRAKPVAGTSKEVCTIVTDILLTNLLASVAVLHDNFGFGERRIEDYLEALFYTVRYFDELAADEVLDAKTEQARTRHFESLKRLLLLEIKGYVSTASYDWLVNQNNAVTRSTPRKKPQISLAEATRLQEDMLKFKKYMEVKTNEQIKT